MATNKQKAAVGSIVVASAGLLAFLGGWEGDERQVYLDIVGVATVCNGHTGPDVKVGDTWTKEQCDAILRKDAEDHGEAVLRCVTVPLNQNQYEALASLTFNIGAGNFCGSTLVKKANAGDYRGMCTEILRWDRAGGRQVRGLTNRRKAEHAKCMTPIPQPAGEAKAVA